MPTKRELEEALAESQETVRKQARQKERDDAKIAELRGNVEGLTCTREVKDRRIEHLEFEIKKAGKTACDAWEAKRQYEAGVTSVLYGQGNTYNALEAERDELKKERDELKKELDKTKEERNYYKEAINIGAV